MSLCIPNPTRSEAVGMWMFGSEHSQTSVGPQRLRDGREDRRDGFEHQLLDGLISKAGQIPQKLSLAHEIGSEHLGKCKCPQTMANVFQQLVFKKNQQRQRRVWRRRSSRLR